MDHIIGGAIGIGLGMLAVASIECLRFAVVEWRLRTWIRAYIETHRAERDAWVAARPWLSTRPARCECAECNPD